MVPDPPGPVLSVRTCAVLGSPITHSLSPVLHAAAYAALGLDWTFERHEVGEGGLADFVAGCGPQWRGLSLTMPLKSEAVELARTSGGEVRPTAELAGVANTLLFEPDPDAAGGRRILVDNTDVDGFVQPVLRRFGNPEQGSVLRSAVILGGGATARSAYVALTRLGVSDITVAARTRAKVEAWQPVFEATGITPRITGFLDFPPSDLLIQTAVAGAADPLAVRIAETQAAVFDVIYHPWPTQVARVAGEAGLVVFSGLDLLAHQAVRQVELMTGQQVDPEVLLAAGRTALYS